MSTFDRINITTQLLPPAARTAETESEIFQNFANPAALYILDVTAVSGTGGLRFRFDLVEDFTAVDTHHPLSIQDDLITAIGTYYYYVGPSARVGGFRDNLRLALAMCLPEKYCIVIEHADGSSYTYQLLEARLIE